MPQTFQTPTVRDVLIQQPAVVMAPKIRVIWMLANDIASQWHPPYHISLVSPGHWPRRSYLVISHTLRSIPQLVPRSKS